MKELTALKPKTTQPNQSEENLQSSIDEVKLNSNSSNSTSINEEEIAPTEITNYMLIDSNFVGYESLEQQEHIYRLASFGIINTLTESVLDLGCGRGDFGSYIKKVINPDIKYTGIDVNKLMIDIGTAKYSELSDNNLKFINTDYFNYTSDDKFDWVFNNINCTIPYGYHTGDQWEQLYDLINKSIDLCKVGCVFILLTTKTEFPGFYQYSPGELVTQLDKKNLRYAVDNTDMGDVFKLVIFKQPF